MHIIDAIEKGAAVMPTIQAPILDVRENGGKFTADGGQGMAQMQKPDKGG